LIEVQTSVLQILSDDFCETWYEHQSCHWRPPYLGTLLIFSYHETWYEHQSCHWRSPYLGTV